MKPFLRWEYDLFINRLHVDIIGHFSKLGTLSNMVPLVFAPGIDITVDEFRHLIGGSDHPDTVTSNPLNRGAAYLWETNVEEEADFTIPQWVLDAYGLS